MIGDTVVIKVTKEGVKFTVSGDMGTGSILCKQDLANDDPDQDRVVIRIEEEVALTFSLRYLAFFTKVRALIATLVGSLALSTRPLRLRIM